MILHRTGSSTTPLHERTLLHATPKTLNPQPLMQVLMSDTVGFIQKLPPKLVAAFRATLEEIREASLILHVVDISHPGAAAQSQAVIEVGRCPAFAPREDLPQKSGGWPLKLCSGSCTACSLCLRACLAVTDLGTDKHVEDISHLGAAAQSQAVTEVRCAASACGKPAPQTSGGRWSSD